MTTTTTLAAENVLRLNVGWLDYLLVAIYFVFVLGIGLIARSQISTVWTSSSPAGAYPRG
jgi:SSS family solute:Na+ symporter